MNFKISAYIIHNKSIKRKVFRKEIKDLITSLKINLNQISNQEIPKENHSNFRGVFKEELSTLLNKIDKRLENTEIKVNNLDEQIKNDMFPFEEYHTMEWDYYDIDDMETKKIK